MWPPADGNPVHFISRSDSELYEAGWYFWDENWMKRFGPFNSKEEANKACKDYAEKL